MLNALYSDYSFYGFLARNQTDDAMFATFAFASTRRKLFRDDTNRFRIMLTPDKVHFLY